MFTFKCGVLILMMFWHFFLLFIVTLCLTCGKNIIETTWLVSVDIRDVCSTITEAGDIADRAHHQHYLNILYKHPQSRFPWNFERYLESAFINDQSFTNESNLSCRYYNILNTFLQYFTCKDWGKLAFQSSITNINLNSWIKWLLQ